MNSMSLCPLTVASLQYEFRINILFLYLHDDLFEINNDCQTLLINLHLMALHMKYGNRQPWRIYYLYPTMNR